MGKMDVAIERKERDHGKYLIGVYLIYGDNTETRTCLGVVMVTQKQDMDLHNLRTMLYTQMATLPENFVFCTSQGWHISRSYEKSVFVRQVLTEDDSVFIQRQFEKPCVGIRQKSGDKLCVVFVDLHCTLIEARKCIQTQLEGHTTKLSRHAYQFLTPSGWPINSKQEGQLTVIDILTDSSLIVDVDTFLTPISSPLIPSPLPRKKIKGTRHLSFRTSKDLGRKQVADSSMTDEKQILISYVRVDAAHHALALKEELSALGFTVYLDVHEITSGVDWQDSLNNAVRSCQIFVPLVTPKYGETLWTNREVKLADVLGKYIVPVNFLPEWPPPCLAIQFSTTQYITWNNAQNSGIKKDYSTWDPRDLKFVACKIAEKVNKFLNTDSDIPFLMKRKTIVRSCPFVDESNSQASIENRGGRQMVVVSLHPKQAALGEEIKSWLLGYNFEVWCTTELSMNYPDSLADSGIRPCSIEMRNRQIFQQQADEAGVVVFILSKDFVFSRTCQQQVFYCEQRKKLIPILCGDFVIPGWLTVLTGGNIIMNVECYKDQLLGRINHLLISAHIFTVDSVESVASDLKDTLSNRLSVYISGATVLDYSEKVCRSIGENLANFDNLVIGTRGNSNTENFIVQSFYQESIRLWKVNNMVLHIQTGSQVEVKSHGKSFQVKSELHDGVVSKAFDVCLFLGDGMKSSLVENFTWNEKMTIPVLNTETKNLEKPQSVSEKDWSVLSDRESQPDQIGQSVGNIITNLVTMETPSNTEGSPNTQLRKMSTVLLP